MKRLRYRDDPVPIGFSGNSQGNRFSFELGLSDHGPNMMAHVPHNRFHRLDHIGNCRRIVGPARKCIRGFFDGDSTTTRVNPQRICRRPSLAAKTIEHADMKMAYFKALRAEVPELMYITMGRQRIPRYGDIAIDYVIRYVSTRFRGYFGKRLGLLRFAKNSRGGG